MSTEKPNKDFKDAYQELVDAVEELVVKEGKSLQEAFQLAEYKLDKWEELSQEEVQEISHGLKKDFQNLGHGLNLVKESYKEELKLDAAYITDSIWDKLLNIMDSNTAQLLAFEKNLDEQVQELTTAEHITNHQEHSQWESEHKLWLSEIALWKKESIQAQAQLEAIEIGIKKYSDALDEHAQVVQAHESSEHDHEKTMAKAEKDPTSQVFAEADEDGIELHKQEKHEHDQHAELHQSMKKHHAEMMSLINRLYKKVI